jgi:hypothetical protein
MLNISKGSFGGIAAGH